MDDKQTKGSKKITEKLINNKPLTERDFRFLRDNPEKFKNIRFIKRNFIELRENN